MGPDQKMIELERRVRTLETAPKARDVVRDALQTLQGRDGITVQVPIISGEPLSKRIQKLEQMDKSGTLLYITIDGEKQLMNFKAERAE